MYGILGGVVDMLEGWATTQRVFDSLKDLHEVQKSEKESPASGVK